METVNSYSIKGKSTHSGAAIIHAKSNDYSFGIKPNQTNMAGPADILLSAFGACCLKNVERFSTILKFEYDEADIVVEGIRQDKPPMIHTINYVLQIKSDDPKLNPDLLHKNLKKFGTIYNTLNAVCKIDGEIIIN